jgi:hypothetical protein
MQSRDSLISFGEQCSGSLHGQAFSGDFRSHGPGYVVAWIPQCSAIGACSIFAPPAILAEIRHSELRILIIPPDFSTGCRCNGNLARPLSHPLQENIEVETTSQNANRSQDKEGHETSGSRANRLTELSAVPRTLKASRNAYKDRETLLGKS